MKDISLRIRAGEKIAIVGQNGSGKTTLVKLLLQFYDPTQGHILCNGKWIGEYPIASYRNQFGTVFQDFQLFSETVAENIMVKRPLSGQQRKDAETALQKADMLERINDLPNKMDTLVGREFAPDGAVFSGGETQKLAIARAIAKDAPVLILDEPNTYIDKRFEAKLYSLLEEINRERAIVLVSHDIGTVLQNVKSIACVNGTLDYHPDTEVPAEWLEEHFGCPIELLGHGNLPHRVLKCHHH